MSPKFRRAVQEHARSTRRRKERASRRGPPAPTGDVARKLERQLQARVRLVAHRPARRALASVDHDGLWRLLRASARPPRVSKSRRSFAAPSSIAASSAPAASATAPSKSSLNAVAAAASSCATARRLGWCLCRRERRAKLDAVVASASASMHLMLHIAAIATALELSSSQPDKGFVAGCLAARAGGRRGQVDRNVQKIR